MRSKYLVDFRRQLSELNNSFSHYIFVWEQFYIDNNSLLKNEKEGLTTEVYSTNSNARQFNVRLKFLDASHEKTYAFILKSLFLLAYSEYEVYMRNLYEFARKADMTLPHLTIWESIPDDVFKHLKIDTENKFEKQEFRTFDYLRLRRNRITHSGGQSKGELADLIRQKGNSLQKFWNKRLTNGTFGLDFKAHETEIFNKKEVFDLINIWRVLIEKTDGIVCEAIGKEGIIQNLKADFIKENKAKIKSWKKTKSKRKFKGYCEHEFDLDLDKDDLEKIIDFNGDVA